MTDQFHNFNPNEKYSAEQGQFWRLNVAKPNLKGDRISAIYVEGDVQRGGTKFSPF